MTTLRTYVYRRLLPSSEQPPSGPIIDVIDQRDHLLLPESLGGFFFGISFVMFFLAARDIYSKVSSTLHKALALAGLGAWFLLALLFHAQGAATFQLRSSVNSPVGGVCEGAFISAALEYRQGLLTPASVIFMISAWVTGSLLVWRSFTLSNRNRWVLYTFGASLVAVIISEIVFLVISYEFAWPAYPIGNLALNLLIGIFVTYCHVTRPNDQKGSSLLARVSDFIVDSGMIFTVALLLFLVLPLAGVTMYFSQNVIFHVQSITSCMLISRIVDTAYPPGTVKLGDDADSLNERVIASTSA